MSIPDSRLPLASPRETHFALHPDEKTAILPSQELQDQGCWSWREKSPWIALALFALVAAVFLILHGRDEANPATATTWKGDAGIAKEWTFSEPIQLLHKPEADQRLYQYYVLPNGMHVLNVQDNDTRQMAMAVAVRAGSFDDPKELPGLAHFCEHMLFLGTEKYPQATGFDDFLTKYGGSSNAFTASEVTVYYASASKSAAKEALDRFADFFRAPLFKKQYVKKEVQAINSEHAKNRQTNDRRILELLNSKADPASVVPHFATGDTETLYEGPRRNGTSPVDALQSYFKSRYCPPQMRLVTFGPDPLAEQLRLAQAAGFGELPRGRESCGEPGSRSFAEPKPFPSSRMGWELLVQGTNAAGQLWLHFEFPDLTSSYASQPLSYVRYVLGYQGENSLYRILSDGLSLVSGLDTMADGSSAGTSFYVVISLTDMGYQKSDAVLDVVFSYIASLRHAGVDRELYQSLADMLKLQWDWSEPQRPADAASGLAETMTRLPREELLSGDSLIEKPEPELVGQLLHLLQPGNMNVALVAPSGLGDKPLIDLETDLPRRTLPHYDVHYVERRMTGARPGASERWAAWLEASETSSWTSELRRGLEVAELLTASDSLVLPPEIPKAIQDIPRQISLEHMHATTGGTAAAIPGSGSKTDELFGPTPASLSVDLKASKDQSMVELLGDAEPDLWYRSGWMSKSPTASLVVALRPRLQPGAPEVSALDSMRLKLYGRLLNEEIGAKLVDLTAAGSSYSISAAPHGLSLEFAGYEEALPHLISEVLAAFNGFNANLEVTKPARFARLVKGLRQELETFDEMPVQYAKADMVTLLVPGYSRPECLAALDGLGLTPAASAAGDLLLSQPLELTALAMGNFDESQAQKALQSIAGSLARPPSGALASSKATKSGAAPGEVVRVTPVVNPSVPVEIRAPNPRLGDPNDVASVTLIYGVADVESRVVFGILSSLLSTAAFEELRTQRQLGYVVAAGVGFLSNVLYVTGLVQGTKLRADEAEAAIEGLFTTTMPKILRNMTEDAFFSQVDAFRQQVLEPPLGSSGEVSHFWDHIKEGGDCLHLLDNALHFLRSPRLTRQLLVETWEKLALGKVDLGNATSHRKKISVKYFADLQTDGNASKVAAVPLRMSLEQARAIWQSEKTSPEAAELLAREWSITKVVDRADAKVRQELAQEGGYFSKDLHCSEGGSSLAADLEARFVDVPQESFLQVRQDTKQRQRLARRA